MRIQLPGPHLFSHSCSTARAALQFEPGPSSFPSHPRKAPTGPEAKPKLPELPVVRMPPALLPKAFACGPCTEGSPVPPSTPQSWPVFCLPPSSDYTLDVSSPQRPSLQNHPQSSPPPFLCCCSSHLCVSHYQGPFCPCLTQAGKLWKTG